MHSLNTNFDFSLITTNVRNIYFKHPDTRTIIFKIWIYFDVKAPRILRSSLALLFGIPAWVVFLFFIGIAWLFGKHNQFFEMVENQIKKFWTSDKIWTKKRYFFPSKFFIYFDNQNEMNVFDDMFMGGSDLNFPYSCN